MQSLAEHLGRACLTSWAGPLRHGRFAQLALLHLFRVIIVVLDPLLFLQLRTVRPAVFERANQSAESTNFPGLVTHWWYTLRLATHSFRHLTQLLSTWSASARDTGVALGSGCGLSDALDALF